MLEKLPEPEDIQEKADAVIEKSEVGRKIRDQVSWAGIVIFGTVIVLVIHAVIDNVILA